MWDDEASVVWFAKNYNQQGKILGYDGTHLFSYRNGQLINNRMEYNNPPLDIYYAAAIIRYFGDSDFTMRFSFALLGFIALALYLWCFRIIADKDNIWFLFASSFLCLSVNYLLIEANTRYYSLNFLFAAISLLATLKMVQQAEKKWIQKSLFLLIQLIAIYFLFLSHYLAAVCWWLILVFILIKKGQINLDLKRSFNWILATGNLILLTIIAHYIISQHALDRPDLEGKDAIMTKYLKLIEWLFTDLHRVNIIPIWALIVFAILFAFKKHLLSTNFKHLMLTVLLFIVAIVALNPQPTSASLSFDIRYLYVIIPLLYLLFAYVFKLIYDLGKYGKFMSIIVAVLFINTTLLSALPSDDGPQWHLPNYIKESSQPFPTAYSEAINYINKNFHSRKKILTLPGFHNTVFFRYVPDKIETTNTLEPSTPLSKSLIDSLGLQCLYIGQCKPDYVFQFGTTETLADYPFKASDFKYIDTIPIYAYGVDVTRPELYWHSFGPRKIRDMKAEALYIFHN